MNQIVIKGRLTRDPELKTTNSDVSVCSFSVAVNRRFDKDTADFFNCSAWRKTGEFVSSHFVKGQEICLSGEMQSHKYVDKDGNNRVQWEINVDNVEFCGKKSDNESSGENAGIDGIISTDEDEVPF